MVITDQLLSGAEVGQMIDCKAGGKLLGIDGADFKIWICSLKFVVAVINVLYVH